MWVQVFRWVEYFHRHSRNTCSWVDVARARVKVADAYFHQHLFRCDSSTRWEKEEGGGEGDVECSSRREEENNARVRKRIKGEWKWLSQTASFNHRHRRCRVHLKVFSSSSSSTVDMYQTEATVSPSTVRSFNLIEKVERHTIVRVSQLNRKKVRRNFILYVLRNHCKLNDTKIYIIIDCWMQLNVQSVNKLSTNFSIIWISVSFYIPISWNVFNLINYCISVTPSRVVNEVNNLFYNRQMNVKHWLTNVFHQQASTIESVASKMVCYTCLCWCNIE